MHPVHRRPFTSMVTGASSIQDSADQESYTADWMCLCIFGFLSNDAMFDVYVVCLAASDGSVAALEAVR